MNTAKDIITYMESLRDDKQRANLMRFFKTGPGQYGEGDEFLGLKVPQTREIVKAVFHDYPLSQVPELLMSQWHEVRLCGLLILVCKFEKLATKRLTNDTNAIAKRDEILTMYLQYAERANNWDLVDLSAPKILGHWLMLPSNLGERDYKIKVLDELAASPCLWKQRMSIVCSWKTSQLGDPSWCLRYAEIHLHHPHDLMRKAVGWMLREMGSRISMDLLRDFLRQHAHKMPRTTLRYAIEKMSETERKEWMDIPTEKAKPARTKISPFAGIPTPLFTNIILHNAQQSDEAVFYLLHHRLDRQLREIYEIYHRQLFDSFEDIIDDFFLYLREGKDGTNRLPYQSLQNIKNSNALETWLLNTFRNYLGNRTKDEERISYADVSVENLSDDLSNSLTEEQKLNIVAHLIAYALQVYYPRGRFILLRMLLTMLNKHKALPNQEIAKCLGMTDISYRVSVHRIKCNLTKFRHRLLKGENLRLDDDHKLVAQRICDDFSHLYPTLLAYYTQTIDTLKCADAIKLLRQEHYESTGLMAHEPTSDDYTQITIKAFWNKLNRLLII